MERLKMVEEATGYIKEKIKYSPKIGIILGSGLGTYGDGLENAQYCDYKDIPYFPVSTVEGHKGRFVINEDVICMQGRFHFYEGYSMQQITFPIQVMKKMGVENLIVTNACGGVNKSFHAGDLMIITDHINFMGSNPLIGKNLEEFGPRFPDMSEAYCKEYQELALKTGKELGIELQKGVYMAFTGPNYETPAEVRMAGIVGADAVGMSTVPEVLTAVHCGMKVLGISCITNLAAGVMHKCLNHAEVIEMSEKVKPKFVELISKIIDKMK